MVEVFPGRALTLARRIGRVCPAARGRRAMESRRGVGNEDVLVRSMKHARRSFTPCATTMRTRSKRFSDPSSHRRAPNRRTSSSASGSTRSIARCTVWSGNRTEPRSCTSARRTGPFRSRWSWRAAGGASTPRPGSGRSCSGGSATTRPRRFASARHWDGRRSNDEAEATSDDPIIRYAERLLAPADTGAAAEEPFHGYYFRVVTNVPARARPRPAAVTPAARRREAWPFVAYPAEYRSSGVMTFVVTDDGALYEKDLGPDTATVAPRPERAVRVGLARGEDVALDDASSGMS